MLKTLVDRLVCPECAPVLTTLTVHAFDGDQGVHVQTGVLRCERCARLFTIDDGVLELLSDGLRDPEARAAFAARFRDALQARGLLEGMRDTQGATAVGLEDQLKQRKHFDWYAENDTQSYSEYQRTPFWTACDALVLARWRPMMSRSGWVLDLGCADGRGGFQFLEQSDRTLIGFDVSRKMVERAAARAKAEGSYDRCSFLVADANNPPFKNESFEYAVTYGVLHHLPDPGRSCREIQRLLKVRGIHFALENNKTIFRPVFDLLMKLRPIWTEEAGNEPLISSGMVEDWIAGLPAKLTTSTMVFLPPHLFNMVGHDGARKLLAASDALLSRIPVLGGQGGEIVIEIEKTA